MERSADVHGFNGAATMGSRKTWTSVGTARPQDVLQWGRDDGVAEDDVAAGDSPRRSLQWGRDDGVAEDVMQLIVEDPTTDRLQWGRDDGVAEDERRARRIDVRRRLQWGRDDGVAEDADLADDHDRMELQWGRDDGVAEDAITTGGIADCARLQWGRDDGVAEDAPCVPRPGSEDRELQWGRDDGVAEDTWRPAPVCSQMLGFNGAATMGSRKTPTHGATPVTPGDASMGPRRWGRGRRRSLTAPRVSPSGFNGAATMGSRKTMAASLRMSAADRVLQWGRDDGVAEDAGIEPSVAGARELQWGRDDGVAEDVSDA